MGRAAVAQASRLLPRAACLTRLPGAFPGNVKARKFPSTTTRVPRNAELTATKGTPSFPRNLPLPPRSSLVPRDLPFSPEIFPCSPRSSLVRRDHHLRTSSLFPRDLPFPRDHPFFRRDSGAPEFLPFSTRSSLSPRSKRGWVRFPPKVG